MVSKPELFEATKLSRSNSVRFLFVLLDEEKFTKIKLDTQEQLLAFWMLLSAHRNVKIHLDEQHVFVKQTLQSALKLMGFWNNCCEL